MADLITLPRETVQQAYDYIDSVPDDRYNAEHIAREALVAALRTALEAPAAREPLAMLFGTLPVHDCTEQKSVSDYRDWDYQDHLDSHPTPAAREQK